MFFDGSDEEEVEEGAEGAAEDAVEEGDEDIARPTQRKGEKVIPGIGKKTAEKLAEEKKEREMEKLMPKSKLKKERVCTAYFPCPLGFFLPFAFLACLYFSFELLLRVRASVRSREAKTETRRETTLLMICKLFFFTLPTFCPYADCQRTERKRASSMINKTLNKMHRSSFKNKLSIFL